jgi:hypothetical protein
LFLCQLRQEDSTESWWPSQVHQVDQSQTDHLPKRPLGYSTSWMRLCIAKDYLTASSKTWVLTSTTTISANTMRIEGYTFGMSPSRTLGPTDKSSTQMGWYLTPSRSDYTTQHPKGGMWIKELPNALWGFCTQPTKSTG